MDCITKLLRFAVRQLLTTNARFKKGSSNPCSDPADTLQPGEFGVNLTDITVEIGMGGDIAQIPCAIATDGDHLKPLVWDKDNKKWVFVESGGGDFSDGGEATDKNRTLGNTDSYALGFLTNGVQRLTLSADGKVGVNKTNPQYLLDVVSKTHNETVARIKASADDSRLEFHETSSNKEIELRLYNKTGDQKLIIGTFATIHNGRTVIMTGGSKLGIGESQPDEHLHVKDGHIKLEDGQLMLAQYTVATAPAGKTGGMIMVTDEVGGITPAFWDGSDWRRTSDRAVIST